MATNDQSRTLSYRIVNLLERRSGAFLLAILGITALLILPLVFMRPNERASEAPGGRVYDLEDLFNSSLPPRFHGSFFIAEGRGGDILTQESLWEIRQNTERLRQTDRDGKLNPPGLPEQPYLFQGFDVDRQQPVLGIFTLADAVEDAFARNTSLPTSLEEATDEQVKVALHHLLRDPATALQKRLLYRKPSEVERRTVLGQEVDYWTAPAMGVFVAADNAKLGGGTLRIGATSDPVTTGKEHFSRKVQAILRGDQESYRLWGVAIDASLEIMDEVGTTVPFIAATFIVVLLVVGLSMRSAGLVFLTAFGLAFMIIWLKGLSNLVGLKSSTTLDFIVPIAMISLGADFAIHAVSRYREERSIGLDPRGAFRLGMTGVLAALFLAMVTDALAFLSNASADIETVVGFAIGAGLAIVAAFVIMGLAVPVAKMRMDGWRSKVIAGDENFEDSRPGRDVQPRRLSVAGLVVTLARWRIAVIALTVLVTAVAAFYALQLEATFDVRDSFKGDADFVVGLDKLDEHVGQKGGESAIVFIQGDLSDPSALDAISEFTRRVADNPYVARTDHGEASLQARSIFVVLEQVMRSDYARAQIEAATGVSVSGQDDISETQYEGKTYRWPDSREKLRAIYDYVAVNGVSLSPTQKIYDPLEVRETLFHDPAGAQEDVTAIVLGIPGTREQTTVIESRDSLVADIRTLESNPSISLAGLTGSPYTRQAALDATTSGLQRALVVAVAACIVVCIVAMRSVRYGVVTIIPVGLVVAWLYAFMYLFGFGLNFVTATIAAVSIGVGIDYAIHMTQRFREELPRAVDSTQALSRAAHGTGMALIASAATSILGFAIMGFAPMPMFSSYGILTAVMIFLAAAASLVVLPSLLLMVTPRKLAGGLDTPKAPSQLHQGTIQSGD